MPSDLDPLERVRAWRRCHNGGDAMPTAKEYRYQAVECLELAEASEELYVKEALLELAAEFQQMAESLDREARGGKHRPIDADVPHRRRRAG
jgi:hypothetical protein